MLTASLKSSVFISNTQVVGIHECFGCEALAMVDLAQRRFDMAPFLKYINTDSLAISQAGKLVFTGNLLGDDHEGKGLFTCQPDGSGHALHTWIHGQTDEQMDAPVFSPDCSSIAYDIINGRRDGVYLTSPQTKVPRRMVREGFAPSWSPDRQWVACCVRERAGELGEFIVVVPVAGGPLRYVCEGYGPEWSPDGKRLCFTDRTRRGRSRARVGIIGADGSNRQLLTPEESDAYYPKWSPGGDFLYFSMDGNVSTLDLARNQVDHVVPTTGPLLWPTSISPDGRWIVYDAEYHTTHDLNCQSSAVHLSNGEIVNLGDLPVEQEMLKRILEANAELQSTIRAGGKDHEYLRQVQQTVEAALME